MSANDNLDVEIERAVVALKRANRIAVLTGAGVSAESGVPTFRASDGLWEGHPIEKVATPMGFRDDPALVWQFYNARRANRKAVKPNPGHYALVVLERHWGDRFTLITQNVDGLHQEAGNTRVLEIHGSLRRTRCTKCHAVQDQGLEPLDELPKCQSCGGLLRPDIVWFHESLPHQVWQEASRASEQCDVFLVVGTSAVVYPAASLIQYSKYNYPMATVIECNLTTTDASSQADIGLYGPSGQTLPRVIEGLGMNR